MKNIILLFALILSISSLNAQTVSDFEKLITSGNAERWVLDSMTTHLGDNTCSDGIIFSFSLKNKKVLRKDCVNNKWKSGTFEWKVLKNNTEFYLEITDGTHFEMDYLEIKGKKLLRLRGMIRSDKSLPVSDYYFRID